MTKVSEPSNIFSINALSRNLALKNYSEKLLSPAKQVLTLNCFSFGGNYYKQTNGVATSTKTGPSYADLLTGLLNTNFSVEATALNVNSAVATFTTVMALPNGATSCTREELTQFISVVNSHHPALKYTWKISNSSLAFLDVKIEIEGKTVYALAFTTNPQIYIVSCCIHLRIACQESFLPFSQFL